MSSKEIAFSAKTLDSMMAIVESCRNLGNRGFSQLGAEDARSFLIGLICGIAVKDGVSMPAIIRLVHDPTVVAMLDGASQRP